MNKEAMNALIVQILQSKEEIERHQHNIELAKAELMKAMDEQGLEHIVTEQGSAFIREYQMSSYDSQKVRSIVSKLKHKEQVLLSDLEALVKLRDVKYVIVRGLL